jgi:hypothetical protein
VEQDMIKRSVLGIDLCVRPQDDGTLVSQVTFTEAHREDAVSDVVHDLYVVAVLMESGRSLFRQEVKPKLALASGQFTGFVRVGTPYYIRVDPVQVGGDRLTVSLWDKDRAEGGFISCNYRLQRPEHRHA